MASIPIGNVQAHCAAFPGVRSTPQLDSLVAIPQGVYDKYMAIIDLTKKTFSETLSSLGIVLVDFWAGWCAPCRMFAPTYAAAAEKHLDVTFGKVDTEAEQQISAAAGISSIPTLMAFRDGILVFSQPGALALPALEKVIAAVRALDMGEVRLRLAGREEATIR